MAITGKVTDISRSFRDIKLSFLKNPGTDDVTQVKDANAIRDAVRNIVMTRFGEKPFNQSYGSQVGNLLFENADQFLGEVLKDEIETAIKNFEPRVTIENTDIYLLEDSNEIEVEIEFKIIGQPLTQTVTFLLAR
jgi:phage baseplate assembly protein W